MDVQGGQMNDRQTQLSEAFNTLERTGDLAYCKQKYPHLSEEIDHFWRVKRLLHVDDVWPDQSEPRLQARSRLQSALAVAASRRRQSSRPLRLAAVLVLAGLGISAAVGANAAGVDPRAPAHSVLRTLGVEHGQSVSDAVHEAIQNTPPGPERGRAISEAACGAAHNRLTLPPGAQAAPGQQGQPQKQCPEADGVPELEEDEELPDALKGTVPGPGRARAAREAACQVAHQGLPPGEPDPGVCQPMGEEAEEDEDDPESLGNTAPGPGRGRAAREQACQAARQDLPPGAPEPGVCGPIPVEPEEAEGQQPGPGGPPNQDAPNQDADHPEPHHENNDADAD